VSVPRRLASGDESSGGIGGANAIWGCTEVQTSAVNARQAWPSISWATVCAGREGGGSVAEVVSRIGGVRLRSRRSWAVGHLVELLAVQLLVRS
jgi:hypothetical protein